MFGNWKRFRMRFWALLFRSRIRGLVRRLALLALQPLLHKFHFVTVCNRRRRLKLRSSSVAKKTEVTILSSESSLSSLCLLSWIGREAPRSASGSASNFQTLALIFYLLDKIMQKLVFRLLTGQSWSGQSFIASYCKKTALPEALLGCASDPGYHA